MKSNQAMRSRRPARFEAHSRFFWLLAVPLVAAIVATVLFLEQGGFAAGHGQFDLVLGILGLPGIFLVEYLPVPQAMPDFLRVVLFPALLNTVLWMGLTLTLRAVLREVPTN